MIGVTGERVKKSSADERRVFDEKKTQYRNENQEDQISRVVQDLAAHSLQNRHGVFRKGGRRLLNGFMHSLAKRTERIRQREPVDGLWVTRRRGDRVCKIGRLRRNLLAK